MPDESARTLGIDRQVGFRIRKHRLASGFSEAQLANRLGVTGGDVQKWERGVTRATAGELCEIAAIFRVPVASFFADINFDMLG